MTKQHFIALADEISFISDMKHRMEAAFAVANVAKRFNSRFNAAKFYAACKVEF